MTFEELQDKVLDWAGDKDLLHERNSDKQFMKFIEEVFEFKTELDCNNEFFKRELNVNIESVKLEFGDILVTLIILANQLNIDPVECLDLAYKKIKDRHGKTINGTFVKAEDL